MDDDQREPPRQATPEEMRAALAAWIQEQRDKGYQPVVVPPPATDGCCACGVPQSPLGFILAQLRHWDHDLRVAYFSFAYVCGDCAQNDAEIDRLSAALPVMATGIKSRAVDAPKPS